MQIQPPASSGAADDFASSDELYERAVRVDARAYSRGDILVASEGHTVYPRYVDRLEGAYVWDTDQHRYLDYNLGYGPVVLGHADPRVTAAVTDALMLGNCVAPYWSPRQVELCETLVRLTPGSDMAYLLKTGSDATSAAVRLARIATDRDLIVRWGYNGWHDWACPERPGIPAAVRDLTLGYEYGDIASLEDRFRLHPQAIAAVVMMPTEAVVSAAKASTMAGGADSCGLRSACWMSVARWSRLRCRPPRRNADRICGVVGGGAGGAHSCDRAGGGDGDNANHVGGLETHQARQGGKESGDRIGGEHDRCLLGGSSPVARGRGVFPMASAVLSSGGFCPQRRRPAAAK